MSIERIERKRGAGWRVRWREAGRNRARVFDRKADAVAFEAETRRRARTGDLVALDAGRQTLQEFAEEWWRLYAAPNLAPTTLASYASLWDAHVLPRLGATRLRDIDPQTIARLRADLTTAGVGTVVDPQGDGDPARRARTRRRVAAHPGQPRARRPQAAAAARARRPAAFTGHGRAHPRGSARERPARATPSSSPCSPMPGSGPAKRLHSSGATSASARSSSSAASCSASSRRRRPAEPGRSACSPRSPPTWASGVSPAAGRPTTRSSSPAIAAASGATTHGATGAAGSSAPRRTSAGIGAPVRPYDLRHSFVSLLIAEGANVVEIARQAGHSPTITLSTYAHLFDERPPGQRSAEDEIRAARQALRYPRRTRFVPENQLELFPDLEESPANPRKPTRGFEPRTPSLRVMCSTS